MKNSKKGLFILLIIVITAILVVIVGIFVYQDKRVIEDSETNIAVLTTNWKAYNGIYPISFSYPPDLILSEGDADFASIIRLWKDVVGKREDTIFDIFIPFDRKSSPIEATVEGWQARGYVIDKELFIDGILAIQLIGLGQDNISTPISQNAVVISQNREQVYVIVNYKIGENNLIFEEILKSIKFTK